MRPRFFRRGRDIQSTTARRGLGIPAAAVATPPFCKALRCRRHLPAHQRFPAARLAAAQAPPSPARTPLDRVKTRPAFSRSRSSPPDALFPGATSRPARHCRRFPAGVRAAGIPAFHARGPHRIPAPRLPVGKGTAVCCPLQHGSSVHWPLHRRQRRQGRGANRIVHPPQGWHAEPFDEALGRRDYLVKRVFPDLHDWCERRRLRLVDSDSPAVGCHRVECGGVWVWERVAGSFRLRKDCAATRAPAMPGSADGAVPGARQAGSVLRAQANRQHWARDVH